MRLNIKPLSVNEAWQGKRYKTPQYKRYERDVILLLRPMEIPEGPLELHITWGFSNAASDLDNPAKLFIDCLQKKYGFDDKRITKLVLEKVKVKKGEEFIEWEVSDGN